MGKDIETQEKKQHIFHMFNKRPWGRDDLPGHLPDRNQLGLWRSAVYLLM